MSDPRYKRKTEPRRIPAFDPGPSGCFAHRVMCELGIRGAVIGRLAVWAWVPDPGEHQFTKDLDIAVAREDTALIRNWLNRQGLPSRELSIGGVNVRHSETGVNVDFIDRANPHMGDFGPLFREAIRASRQTVLVGEVELPLAPAEHLALMKLATGETDDEKDAERIMEFARPSVATMRRLAARFLGVAMVARLEGFLRRIGHRAARP